MAAEEKMTADEERDIQEGEEEISADGKTTSALRHNIKTKGANAYYYAHNREFSVPDDAIVRTGPGIITGGAPTRLEEPDFEPTTSVNHELRKIVPPGCKKIEKYMLVDEAEKIQVIWEVTNCLTGSEKDSVKSLCAEGLDVAFRCSESGFVCVSKVGAGEEKSLMLAVDNLKHLVVPEKSKHRVNKDKAKVTITLWKQMAQKWGGQLMAEGSK
ncbi:unnamed protein product [Amoebophrya sp. A25]|nr:unnamed protein product [Amoebophrya sp. A25]|eukprot:GSA25T00024494001.1